VLGAKRRASKGDGRSSFEAHAPRAAFAPQDDGAGLRQRIDKWLWHARMVRTRSDAAALVEAGHARLNGQRVTAPGHSLRVGDVVTLALDRSVRVVEVAGFCERRGGPPEAIATYRDLSARLPAKT
jgi:ribosome-associated heat shock protein Hsp15